jgi:trk system potassium uptake protein TrkA
VRVLVYGCGQLASGVVRELVDDQNEIIVLGNERSELERLSNYTNVSAVLLDEPVMHDYLIEAGIATADAFLALSTDDHDNLLVAQIAHRMFGVQNVVCHVENPRLQVIYTTLDRSQEINVVSYSVGILQDIRYAVTAR